jgi:hypothetical protein
MFGAILVLADATTFWVELDCGVIAATLDTGPATNTAATKTAAGATLCWATSFWGKVHTSRGRAGS